MAKCMRMLLYQHTYIYEHTLSHMCRHVCMQSTNMNTQAHVHVSAQTHTSIQTHPHAQPSLTPPLMPSPSGPALLSQTRGFRSSSWPRGGPVLPPSHLAWSCPSQLPPAHSPIPMETRVPVPPPPSPIRRQLQTPASPTCWPEACPGHTASLIHAPVHALLPCPQAPPTPPHLLRPTGPT